MTTIFLKPLSSSVVLSILRSLSSSRILSNPWFGILLSLVNDAKYSLVSPSDFATISSCNLGVISSASSLPKVVLHRSEI